MNIAKFFRLENYQHRAERLFWSARYNQRAHDREERSKFAAAGLDHDAGVARLNEVLSALGMTAYPQNDTMCSIHWVIFACLSKKPGIQRILEIGTFDGAATAVLSALFPNATIDTFDLPPNDPILSSSYGRDDDDYRSTFTARQRTNVSKPNVRFHAANSFFSTRVCGRPFRPDLGGWRAPLPRDRLGPVQRLSPLRTGWHNHGG
ncbi:MAG: hypothetical protein V4527_14665 [Pseudomonadota bacterium]